MKFRLCTNTSVPLFRLFSKKVPSQSFFREKIGFLSCLFLFICSITNAQTYTSSGTYSYTVPSGVTSVTLMVWGAGGGSGGVIGNNSNQAAGGGGGGAFTQKVFTVTAGRVLTITVGAGGTAGTTLGTDGGTGGTSSVTGTGVSITAAGGGGGGGVLAAGGSGTAGTGATTGTGYTTIYAGGNGAAGVRSNAREVGGGGGGGAGSGGAGGNATAGTVTGGGSNSSGGSGGTGTYQGGDGSDGIVSNGNVAGVVGGSPGGGAAGPANGNNTALAGAVGGDGQVLVIPNCTTPTAPSGFTAGTQTSTTAPGSFTAPTGGASDYLVLYNTTGTTPTTPTNGTTYAVGNTSLGATVASSSGTTFTPTGLTANTKYYFFIYSYNNTSCTGGPAYSTGKLTGNITTCAGAPTMGAATSITSSGFTANWTAPSGGSAGTISYIIDVSLSSSFASDISGYPVSGITGLSNSVSGLSSNTKYYYRVTATNGVCATTSSTANTTTSLPACTTPSAPTAFNAGTQTATTAPGSFTASSGGASGYLVLYNTTGTAPAAPTDGTTYAVGNTSLGATVASSSGTSFTPTGLTANTKYYFFIYAYNNTSCTGGPAYSLTSLTGNITTCAGAATMGTATSITSSSFTANWTAPTGGTVGTITYTIDVSLTAGFGSDISGYPVSGITGLSNAVSGLSSNTKYYYRVTTTNGICGTTSSSTNTTTNYPPCTTPSAPTSLALTLGVVNISGTFNAPTTAPTGYLVIRTTSSTAPSAPVAGTTYTAGSSALGGYIVSTNTTTGFTDNGLSPSTQYWYWVYSYNTTTCTGGPLYSSTNITGNGTTSSICGGSYSIYALDDVGYIYPLNTSTVALQTPLNNTVGLPSSANSPNALGYNPANSSFYFLSSVSSGGFMSYDGANTYSTLSTPFSSGAYPVVGTSTVSTGNGYYAIAYQTGALYYYSVATATWTTVTTKIQDGSGNNLSTVISGSEQNGDLLEDGYGSLWILMSSTSAYGLYYIAGPPTTNVTSVTATQVIPYGTALPSSAGGNAFNGAAFDAAGNLFMSTANNLFEIPTGSTTASLVGSFSGLHSGSASIHDLAQCTYTSNPLPVTWTYFTAARQNDDVGLTWGIAQASSVKGFYIQRSTDSRNWDTLGFVQYVNGNMHYNYIDASPNNGANYYRVAETDFDGNANFTPIKEVTFSSDAAISVWPNPTIDAVHVRYNGDATDLKAQIFDGLGRKMITSSIYQGNNTIDLSNVSAGVYFLLLQSGNQEILYKKIVKAK